MKQPVSSFAELQKIPANFACKLIQCYQKTLSPDHGPLKALFPQGYCKFQPTCSQYASEAIQKYGVLKGTLRGAYRILRCNPWSQGGQDNP